jgi:hypothetical protein
MNQWRTMKTIAQTMSRMTSTVTSGDEFMATTVREGSA